MGNETIQIGALASEIGSILSMYSNNVSNETEKWLKETADRTAKRVQENAKTAGFKANPKYVEGWTKKKVNGKWIVYQKNQPGMAHLLEHGHVVIIRGEARGRTRAFPHIKPAEEQIANDIKELEEMLSKVGVKK